MLSVFKSIFLIKFYLLPNISLSQVKMMKNLQRMQFEQDPRSGWSMPVYSNSFKRFRLGDARGAESPQFWNCNLRRHPYAAVLPSARSCSLFRDRTQATQPTTAASDQRHRRRGNRPGTALFRIQIKPRPRPRLARILETLSCVLYYGYSEIPFYTI